MSFGSEDIREWRDEREHFGLDTNTGSWTDYTDGGTTYTDGGTTYTDGGTNYTGSIGDEDTAYTGYTNDSMTDYSAQLSALAQRFARNTFNRAGDAATAGDGSLHSRGRLVKGIKRR